MSRQTLKTWHGHWWTAAVPADWETEAGGAWVWGQPGLHKVLSPKRKRMIKHQTRHLRKRGSLEGQRACFRASHLQFFSKPRVHPHFHFLISVWRYLYRDQRSGGWKRWCTEHGVQHRCNQRCEPEAKVSLPSRWTGQEPLWSGSLGILLWVVLEIEHRKKIEFIVRTR